MNKRIRRSGLRMPANVTAKPRRSCHVNPRRPVIDVRSPGRLRTSDVLGLLSISHSTLYARMKVGELPRPDGNDGRNYWNTSTIHAVLSKGQSLQ